MGKNYSPNVLERIKDELSPVDTEELYRQMINESYTFDSVGGPFEHMEPARVLEEMDPTAYRCGLVDYSDSLSRESRYVEIGEHLYNADEVEEIEDDEAADESK